MKRFSFWKHVAMACFLGMAGTMASARAADPYPRSPFITGLNFHWPTHQRHADGSDNWAVTWADDGEQYGAWGDGWGWAETGDKRSLGVTRISGTSTHPDGTDLWGLPTAGTRGGKSYGILSVGGHLYMWVGPGSGVTSYDEARLYESTTHGTAWTAASWAFGKSTSLVMPTFLNFGQDYANARDEYVYTYFIRLQGNPSGLDVHIPGKIDLARVPETEIMTRQSWTFFTGLDESGSPQWSSDPAARVAVFQDVNGVGWNCSVSYNAGLRRYLLCTEHTSSFEGRLGVFDAPTPWGPWTTAYYSDSDGIFGSGQIETNTFFWNFANKWLSDDGKDFVLVFTGINQNDSYNTVEGTFTADRADADRNGDGRIDLSDLLRVVQLSGPKGFHCAQDTEDGYAPGLGDHDCGRHDSDYAAPIWRITLSELLRTIQFHNMAGYRACPGQGTEDGFCPVME